MNLKYILSFFLMTFVLFGCDKIEKDDFVSSVDVVALKKAMYEYDPITYGYDSETVYKEIKKLMTDLKAKPTKTDEDGHLENVHLLIKRLNQLDGFSAELFCYACIYTLPAKSEISIRFEYNNETVKRQMFVMPAMGKADEFLHFAGIQITYEQE